MARSAARVFKDPPVINLKEKCGTNPWYRNTVLLPSRATTPVWIGTGPSLPPISIRIQEIEGIRRSIIPQEVRNNEPIDTSINRIFSKHRKPAPSCSKVVGSKYSNRFSAGVYARCQMNLASDTVLSGIPNFMDSGLSSVDTIYEFASVFTPTTRVGSATHGSNRLPHSHCISEATSDRLRGTK